MHTRYQVHVLYLKIFHKCMCMYLILYYILFIYYLLPRRYWCTVYIFDFLLGPIHYMLSLQNLSQRNGTMRAVVCAAATRRRSRRRDTRANSLVSVHGKLSYTSNFCINFDPSTVPLLLLLLLRACFKIIFLIV